MGEVEDHGHHLPLDTDNVCAGSLCEAAAKQLLHAVPGMPVDEAFRWTGELSAHLFGTDEAREGMTAFLEKRPAAWVRPTPTQGA